MHRELEMWEGEKAQSENYLLPMIRFQQQK